MVIKPKLVLMFLSEDKNLITGLKCLLAKKLNFPAFYFYKKIIVQISYY